VKHRAAYRHATWRGEASNIEVIMRKHKYYGPTLFKETLAERLRWMGYWLFSRGERRGREVRARVEETATETAERARTAAAATAEKVQAGKAALRAPSYAPETARS
jgi:hypothetical protein